MGAEDSSMEMGTRGHVGTEKFQLLPPLNKDEYNALKEDIRERGVLVPIVLDEDGEILDGHHRMAIAKELGIVAPTMIAEALTDAEKRSMARSLNMQRRHLDQKQKRALIADELKEDPSRSNNAIAKLLGVSDMTVNAVRKDLGIRAPIRKGSDGKTYRARKIQKFDTPEISTPFPWYGGKRRVASHVWQGLGVVDNYVEPFAGSLAVLLGRPKQYHAKVPVETVNDADGFIANFWRATAKDPEGVASFADNPVNENDLHARRKWLAARRQSLVEKLEADPEYFDVEIAGYWVWGISCWIASGWPDKEWRKRPHLMTTGQGVIGRKDMKDTFGILHERMKHVRVCCGDWKRVLGSGSLTYGNSKGIFLDPPYDHDVRDDRLYAVDTPGLAKEAREWAIENGEDPSMRIVLAGYVDEHDDEIPSSWSRVFWTANRVHATGKNQVGRNEVNRERECLWMSPACLVVT